MKSEGKIRISSWLHRTSFGDHGDLRQQVEGEKGAKDGSRGAHFSMRAYNPRQPMQDIVVVLFLFYFVPGTSQWQGIAHDRRLSRPTRPYEGQKPGTSGEVLVHQATLYTSTGGLGTVSSRVHFHGGQSQQVRRKRQRRCLSDESAVAVKVVVFFAYLFRSTVPLAHRLCLWLFGADFLSLSGERPLCQRQESQP